MWVWIDTPADGPGDKERIRIITNICESVANGYVAKEAVEFNMLADVLSMVFKPTKEIATLTSDKVK